MFDGYFNENIQKKAFIKKQRLMARYHRKQMKLREIESRYQKQDPGIIKPNSLQRFFVWGLRSCIGLYFFLKDSASRVYILKLDIFLFFKRKFSFTRQKLREIKALSYLEQKSKQSEHKKSEDTVTKKREFLNTTMDKQAQISKQVIKEKSKKRKGNWLKRLFYGLLFIIIFCGTVFLAWFSTLEIPSVQNFENRKISNSTKIYDKTGDILLYDIHDNIRRTVVDFDQIAQPAKEAIVAIEDHSFYSHGGVVWKSTIRAVLQTLLSKAGLHSGGTAGGSTLTQQVVKNTLLNRDKVLSRKVKEWVLSYKIENKLSKDEILEIYLNEAPYGGTIYGIQEASKRFFGIPASEVSVAQSAYLAAIPNLPTFYSPYGRNVEKLKERQQVVLGEMKRYGFITDNEYRASLREEVIFLPEEENYAKSLHFVQFVREQLEETYGVEMVENGGLHVVTTLDYELQKKAEEIIKNHIDEVESIYNASNAGLVAIDAKTGQIITMVGSRDYSDTDGFDGNFNVALAKRQPGSAFKPLAYVTAFEGGYYPESSIFDTQTQFNANCEPTDFTSENNCYSPRNYDNAFKGPLTFRNALAQSRNIPALKVNYLAGVSDVIQTAKNLGITSLNQKASFYGLGLVLGGGEVSLLEMTNTYATFGNDGVYNKATSILEVKDVEGVILEKYAPKDQRVLDQNATRMLNSVLSDNVARTPLFGVNSFLNFGERKVAGKTGTTNDNRDAWLAGYTPGVAVGVWTGNNDNSPMKKGSSISGKPWRAYMDQVLEKYPNESFGEYTTPDDFNKLPSMVNGKWYGGTTVYIDTVSGKLATEFTPEETKLAVPQPDPHTILHWINKDNPKVPNISENDSQYKNWEYGVRRYVETYLADILNIKFNLPTESDDVHTAEGVIEQGTNSFIFTIKNIDSEEIYEIDEPISLGIDGLSIDEDEIKTIQVFVNNAFITSKEKPPFDFSIIPSELKYFEAKNVLRIILTSIDGIKSTQELVFNLKI